MKRRAAREKAFQVLFQMDINDVDPKEALDHVLENEKPDEFLSDLVFGVVEHKEDIDSRISEHLEKWTIQRLASVERTLLRIATYELFHGEEETPQGVIINEAVEIAHEYGDDKSGKFINGVLSKIIQ
ncbi:transcription antitermination factor NusB [Radiobacillus kanasensis]|uniref:transcription antitermination factor NusB n=1 Tax=Radiobacillus kanasensis TaxID=2844358 RepID=UPI001E296B98|nr:transcription antitermination factor NusB [Radiobacillus kanasensis]UFT97731.1 transcription antitermination factor NusB [Radiobacillus kanasensis]